MDLISNLTNDVVQKAMDGHSQRHVAIASNIANADTPRYRKKTVDFESALQTATQQIRSHRSGQLSKNRVANNQNALELKTSSSHHYSTSGQFSQIADVPIESTESTGLIYRNDQNAVDVESEMVNLARNTQRYVALSNMQSRLARSVRTVINNSGGV